MFQLVPSIHLASKGTILICSIEVIKHPNTKTPVPTNAESNPCAIKIESNIGIIVNTALYGTPTFFPQHLQVAGKIGPKDNLLQKEIPFSPQCGHINLLTKLPQ